MASYGRDLSGERGVRPYSFDLENYDIAAIVNSAPEALPPSIIIGKSTITLMQWCRRGGMGSQSPQHTTRCAKVLGIRA